jgi:hypothetical protein
VNLKNYNFFVFQGIHSQLISTKVLTGSDKLVFSKIIDLFDDGFVGVFLVKECTDNMNQVNVKMIIDKYSSVNVIVSETVKCGASVPFTLPRKSLGYEFQIYVSTTDQKKGSLIGYIQ